MGTRSLTIFIDDNGKEVGVMYNQWDGYYDGYGKDLAKFLSGAVCVNGIPGRENLDKNQFYANGLGCLFAQVVAAFKDGAGSIYLHAPGTRDCGEEYIYTVRWKKSESPNPNKMSFDKYEYSIIMTAESTYSDGDEKFEGDPKDFQKWVKKQNEEE